MLFSFLLFVLIGFIPFVSAYFALDVSLQISKKIVPDTLLFFVIASVAKLFSISVVLPEVQGHNFQTFLITLVIHSFEFVFFRHVFVRCRIQNVQKGNVLAFWWSCFIAFSTTILTFISNSRTEELEVVHLIFAISVLSYLFLYFAMENIVLSIGPQEKIWRLNGKTQVFVLLAGLPAGLGSVDTGHVMPAFVPDLLKLGSSAVLWGVTRWLPPAERISK
jgi:hypothetical protein